MYHLAKSIYLHATSLPEYSILLLGLDNAGKSTLLNQIKALHSKDLNSLSSSTTTDNANPPPTPSSPFFPQFGPSASTTAGKTVPTVGQNTATVEIPSQLYLRIWDVGGQHSLRNLWQSYFKACHAIIFVIDSTDVGDADISKLPVSSQSASSSARAAVADDTSHVGNRLAECRTVLESVLAHTDAAGVPLLVLANKQDREDSESVVAIKEGLVRRVVEDDKGGGVRDSRVLPCSALTGAGVREAVEWVVKRVQWNRDVRPGLMR